MSSTNQETATQINKALQSMGVTTVEAVYHGRWFDHLTDGFLFKEKSTGKYIDKADLVKELDAAAKLYTASGHPEKAGLILGFKNSITQEEVKDSYSDVFGGGVDANSKTKVEGTGMDSGFRTYKVMNGVVALIDEDVAAKPEFQSLLSTMIAPDKNLVPAYNYITDRINHPPSTGKHEIDMTFVWDDKALLKPIDYHASVEYWEGKGSEVKNADMTKLNKAFIDLDQALQTGMFHPTVLDTHIKVGMEADAHVTRSHLYGFYKSSDPVNGDYVLNSDYMGKDGANIQLKLDKEVATIPITHDNMEKLAKAYEAATQAAKDIAAKVKADHKPVSDDEIYNGVTAALKKSLQTSQLIK